MKNLHEVECLWWSGEEDLGIVCTQSNCQCRRRSTFCKFESSQTKVKKRSTFTCIVWNKQYTLSVYTSVECGDRACVLPKLLSLVEVECFSNEDNFLCEVVSSSVTVVMSLVSPNISRDNPDKLVV